MKKTFLLIFSLFIFKMADSMALRAIIIPSEGISMEQLAKEHKRPVLMKKNFGGYRIKDPQYQTIENYTGVLENGEVVTFQMTENNNSVVQSLNTVSHLDPSQMAMLKDFKENQIPHLAENMDLNNSNDALQLPNYTAGRVMDGSSYVSYAVKYRDDKDAKGVRIALAGGYFNEVSQIMDVKEIGLMNIFFEGVANPYEKFFQQITKHALAQVGSLDIINSIKGLPRYSEPVKEIKPIIEMVTKGNGPTHFRVVVYDNGEVIKFKTKFDLVQVCSFKEDGDNRLINQEMGEELVETSHLGLFAGSANIQYFKKMVEELEKLPHTKVEVPNFEPVIGRPLAEMINVEAIYYYSYGSVPSTLGKGAYQLQSVPISRPAPVPSVKKVLVSVKNETFSSIDGKKMNSKIESTVDSSLVKVLRAFFAAYQNDVVSTVEYLK